MMQVLLRGAIGLLAGTFVVGHAAAQGATERNFLAGLVVTQQGDTLRGALQLFPQLHTVAVRQAGQPTHTLLARHIRLVVAEHEVARTRQVSLQPMIIDNRPNRLAREPLSAQQGGVWQYSPPQQNFQSVHLGRRHYISRAVTSSVVGSTVPQYELFEVLESGSFILLQQEVAESRVVKNYTGPIGVKLESETQWIPE